ncbi:GPH family glycoside/pentoside/hexuronide:cation symporter [Novosphingobium kunmingense]|uniref:GPH family glycoside/pentoside/hexuronide:cation symporter n=1 Tax=Novosphingobium kunmingense TaxID=1211806 RepID=A0A2N0HJI6_9SPHN|nr:MFS transporter [Novosphingobium kunmingense]PKB19104.1 GPH family glycoside/pentoside/hexuronide:cation symporter [Novosphingobium kunmingense]
MRAPGPASSAAPLPLRVKLFNGMGSVAYGVKDNGFSTFLLIFYSQVIGLDAKLVSLALMLALLVDAFIDPVIGHLSDKTYTRWGRRHPWLYIAPIPLAFAWLLLWSPPADHTYIFVYLVAVAILVRTLVSCCEVPSQSLVAELTSDYDERTSLIRLRYLFGWLGGLTIYFLANAVFLRPDADHPVGQLNPDGYWRFGLCGAIVMATAVLVSALGQHSRVAKLPAVKPTLVSPGHALGEILEALRHPAAVILLSAALFAISSSQMALAIANYLYLFVWQLSPTGFALLAWLLLVTVVASFLIVRPLHLRLGKRDTAIYCNLASMTIGATPFILRYLGLWPEAGSNASTALIFAFLLFANTTGIMVFVSAQSMLADVVEASYVQTGRRSEGTFAAGWMFVQKCGTAVGIGLTGLIVSLAGLPAKAVPGQVDPGVIDRLTLSYVGIVFVAGICSTLILRRFPITRADHEARVAALDAAAMIDRDAEGAHP